MKLYLYQFENSSNTLQEMSNTDNIIFFMLVCRGEVCKFLKHVHHISTHYINLDIELYLNYKRMVKNTTNQKMFIERYEI